MNHLKGELKQISQVKNLNITEIGFNGETLYMISLELPAKIQKHQEVLLSIKPINIAISKDFHINTSFLNQIKVSIISIEVGELLTSVQGVVNGTILEALITTKAYYRLNLQVGDSIIMLLPAAELFLV